jgi:hypothetical protein
LQYTAEIPEEPETARAVRYPPFAAFDVLVNAIVTMAVLPLVYEKFT